MQEPALVLYSDSSPNGFKITIALEVLGLPYRLVHVDIDRGEHRQADFLALNPAGRIPVLVDHSAGVVLFESAAILLYLAQRSGQLLEQAAQPRWATITWLMYHSASVGPVLGQRVHFECFEAIANPAAQKRYRSLSEDAFGVLDQHLASHLWLAGEAYSIADIAHFAWLHIAQIVGFDFTAYRHLTRWYRQVQMRPAVQRGIRLPAPATGP
ncbi:glutathione S-transferase family protein [Pseudomonas muyukensis]|uniref:Glutathione S-transferase family protein n=1 Tax=Pseudomonas muyukensis TaxID=2842357 RepID=A0ABX8MH41_9PSED|nr:glutathione S-transferase family protein [Pseudomonas muyukensis]QXH37539.1 glutathione S-transferase family protein [Pseudomonas muyukensis]